MTRWPAMPAILLLCVEAVHADVRDVKVTTDSSIDCSSMTTIARDLYRDCKTDEAKAIATWRSVRRTQFHWPKKVTWNSLEVLNSCGYSLCGQQSRMFAEICAAGGLEARTVHSKGHNIAEV